MAVYNVSYDLNKAGKNYEGLIEELKKSSGWWHYLRSTWLISTRETPTQLYNRLQPYLDNDDHILIIEVCNNSNGWLPKKAWEWINSNVRNC
jgi:hypothetical protein